MHKQFVDHGSNDHTVKVTGRYDKSRFIITDIEVDDTVYNTVFPGRKDKLRDRRARKGYNNG